MRKYDQADDAYEPTQYLEIIVRKQGDEPIIDRRSIPLVFSGTLKVDLLANGSVTATYAGESATPSILIDLDTITHVGIQIRKPVNGLPSPTIDNFSSSVPLEPIL